MNLKKVKLVDICKQILSGGTPLTKVTDYYGGNICWLKTKEVNFNRIYDTEIKITELGLLNSSAKIIPENSIIIAMYGNGDTAGRCAINKIPLATNQACCNLIIDESRADYIYIYYLMKSKYEELVNLKNGGAQQNLSLQLIKDIEILLPELDTQRKIGSILSVYDNLIENNFKRIKLLEETAELIYKEWFVNFRFPGYAKFEFVDGIPKAWDKTKIGEYISFVKGKKPKIITEINSENSVLYLLVEVLEGKSFLYTEDKKVPIAMGNEVIMIMDGSRSGTIYKSVYGAIGSTMSIIRINNDKLKDEYLYYFLKLNEIHIKQNNTGSAIPHANKEFIKDMDILIPTQSVMEKFGEYTRNISKQISLLKLQINKLKEARDILIPKLIMGEIEV